jgi:urease accessory protein
MTLEAAAGSSARTAVTSNGPAETLLGERRGRSPGPSSSAKTTPATALAQAKAALAPVGAPDPQPNGVTGAGERPDRNGENGELGVGHTPNASEPAPGRTTSPSASPNLPPGTGHVHLAGPPRSPRAYFTTNHASYPLKLLAPRPLPSQPANVALLYTLAYGGGLVSGDCVQLSCTVDDAQVLVMRTQGSTKVYKHRRGLRPAAHGISPALAAAVKRGEEAPAVRQRMHVTLGAGATFVLLPDALSPFRGSRYVQAQRVSLPPDGSGSVLLLDWINSGRGDRPLGRPELRPWAERYPNGEKKSRWTDAAAQDAAAQDAKSDWGKAEEEYWAMGYYASTNELVVGDRILARERMVLDNGEHKGDSLSPTARRLAPYHVYATVLVYGPQFARLRAHLDALSEGTSQFQVPRPPGLLWSYSPLSEVCGIIRLAGLEVEDVRDWMRIAFEEGGVAELVGPGLWPRCI